MTAKTEAERSILPQGKRRNEMDLQNRSGSPVQNRQSRFLNLLTIGTWIVTAAVSIYSFVIFWNDLRGTEWLGSPLFGLPLLVAIVTAYYLIARNKPIGPTMHIVVWSCILLAITTANMLTLARFVFGAWKSFQYMPVMGAFELVLIAAGVHVSWKEKSRGALFLFLVWTVLMFLLTAGTFAFMNIAFHSSIWRIGIVAGSGAAVWVGLILIAYFGFRSRLVAFPDALACWAWCAVPGAVVSMITGYFYLGQKELIPFYVVAGTTGFAFLATVLKVFTRQALIHRKDGK